MPCRKGHQRQQAAGAGTLVPRADDALIFGARTELALSREGGSGTSAISSGRVVVVHRIGDCISITTARREKRHVTSALVLGGTVLLPIKNLEEIFAEVMASAQDED